MKTKSGKEISEDYTKGYSKSRRSVMSARIDIRSLASIILYLEELDIHPETRSDAIHHAVETLTEILISSGKTERILLVADAYDKLRDRGLKWGDGKNKDSLNKALANESYSFGDVEKMDVKLKKQLDPVLGFDKNISANAENREQMIKDICDAYDVDYETYREFYPLDKVVRPEFKSEKSSGNEKLINHNTFKPTTKEDITVSTGDETKEELEERARRRKREEKELKEQLGSIPEDRG